MKDHRNIGVVVPLLVFVVLLLFVELTFEQTVVVPLSSRTERFALFQLRSSLGIRSKEWPRKSDPCSVWKGITCDGSGRVIGINISGFRRTRLGGRNPQFAVDALGNFTLLKSFNASRFALPGSIPDWFGNRLVSLEVLDLSSCLVSNSIPTSIGNLTNLTTLNLADNSLTGLIPSSLGRLSHLSVLNLSRNTLNGPIPTSFVSLSNFSMLDVSSNLLSGSIPLALGTLSGLQYLNLSRNNLSSSIPQQLGDLRNLVDLDLSFNSLSRGLASDLTGLRSLRRMLLGNNILSGPLPGILFSNPSQLQTVILRNNNFSGEIPIELWSLPALLLLDVSGNNFTGSLPNTNPTLNTTVAVLNISQNQLYGNITEQLRRFGILDLSGNYFEGKVPDFAQINSSLVGNCLQNASNQRSLDDCSSFYTTKGLTFDNFGQPNATAPSPSPAEGSKKKSHRTLYILIGVLGGLGLIAILFMLICVVVICTRKRSSASDRGVNMGAVPGGGTVPTPGASVNIARVGDAYTYQQLLQATGEFSDSNLIKKGHSGDLFKGVLDSGIPVVVKKINLGTVKKESYSVELDFFSKGFHGRFVPFLGHCLENENEKFLIYKYMPNEDLGSSLYKKTSDDDSLQTLDWIKRLKIAVGAAEALSYLHHECNPPLVHRDVQASSILLDDKYEVRMGSLSEVCAQEGDTHQSRISRLLRLPQSSEAGTSDSATANCAYDVYCFGKVLLELVTGKLGISASADAEIKEWLEQTLPCINIYDKELVTKIVDPLLIVDEDLLEEVWAMAIVARSCLNPKPTRRPPMRYVLKALENPLKIVREEHAGSGRLRATSSRGSWNAALFGSWRHSSSDVAVIPASSAAKAEGASSLKQSGTTGSQSQGSGPNGSSSHRRYSKEIFPEPPDQDVERQDQD